MGSIVMGPIVLSLSQALLIGASFNRDSSLPIGNSLKKLKSLYKVLTPSIKNTIIFI